MAVTSAVGRAIWLRDDGEAASRDERIVKRATADSVTLLRDTVGFKPVGLALARERNSIERCDAV